MSPKLSTEGLFMHDLSTYLSTHTHRARLMQRPKEYQPLGVRRTKGTLPDGTATTLQKDMKLRIIGLQSKNYSWPSSSY